MVHVIDQENCIKCGTCLDVCPERFSAVTKVSGEELDVPTEPIPIIASKEKAQTSDNPSTEQ